MVGGQQFSLHRIRVTWILGTSPSKRPKLGICKGAESQVVLLKFCQCSANLKRKGWHLELEALQIGLGNFSKALSSRLIVWKARGMEEGSCALQVNLSLECPCFHLLIPVGGQFRKTATQGSGFKVAT